VSQRQILENSIGLLKTLRGPAKILYAGPAVNMPTIIENVINPTTGAPGASWIPLGLTRGGINVSKNLDITVRDDVDQIIGAFDQDITDRSYVISSQLAEILQDSFVQAAQAAAFGSATTVHATSSQPTQVMRFLDDGANKTPEKRWAIVFPKATNGKVLGFVFRRGAIAGGEKVFRFDKNDPASPGLEIRMFPEIATTIDSEDAYGRIFEIE
jgi:hypothetical protein